MSWVFTQLLLNSLTDFWGSGTFWKGKELLDLSATKDKLQACLPKSKYEIRLSLHLRVSKL